MLQIELKNCFNRKDFKLIFAALWILAIATYLILVMQYHENGVQWLRSACDSSFMINPTVSVAYSTIVLLLPMLVGFACADSYYRDEKSGRKNYICTRISERKYMRSQITTVAIMSFALVVSPLLINFLLCKLTFPACGMDNNYALPPYDIGVQNYTSGYWLDLMRIQNPTVYILIRILVDGIIGMLFALIVYGIYFYEKIYEKNRWMPILIVFGIYIVEETLFSFLNATKYSLSNFLYLQCEGKTWVLGIYIGIMILVAGSLIGYRLHQIQKRREI